jgi:site-specific recombinase XerC
LGTRPRLDEIAELLGHAPVSLSQVHLHLDPARLLEAVDGVATPREAEGLKK